VVLGFAIGGCVISSVVQASILIAEAVGSQSTGPSRPLRLWRRRPAGTIVGRAEHVHPFSLPAGPGLNHPAATGCRPQYRWRCIASHVAEHFEAVHAYTLMGYKHATSSVAVAAEAKGRKPWV